MSQCTQCNFNIPNGARVCGYCGSRQPYKVYNTSWTGRKLGILQGFFVGGLLGAGCAWLFDFSYWEGILWGGGITAVIGFIRGYESTYDPNS